MHSAEIPTAEGKKEPRLTFDGFKEHSNAPRASTEFVVLEILRRSYPDYHVTRTSPAYCDLIGFAKAGNATAKLELDDNAFDASRVYRQPMNRLDSRDELGTLHHHVRFGRYQYTWEGHDFIVYELEFQEPFRGPIRFLYVLSPRPSDSVHAGHHPSTDALLLAVGEWTGQLHEEIYVFDGGMWMKNQELWKSVKTSSWEDVILDSATKQNLIEDVQGFFNSRQLYEDFSVPWKRGIIFHGLPGNGKTISIKALISSLASRSDEIASLYVKSFSACNGPEYSIRAIFAKAREMAPCLLIFEDLDSLVKDEVRSYFLNEVDGLESNDGILMIGSTNHLDKLDPAIANRPSRFDRKYHFRLPSEPERVAYCDYWRRKLAKNPLISFPADLGAVVSKMTEGFSFAYLKELFITTLLAVARGDRGGDQEPEANEAEHHDTNVHADSDMSNGTGATGVNGKEAIKIVEGSLEIPLEAPAADRKQQEVTAMRAVSKQVEIPEHLRDNVLLKVIRRQVQVLIAEMDNTKPEEWLSSKVTGGRVSRRERAAMMGSAVYA